MFFMAHRLSESLAGPAGKDRRSAAALGDFQRADAQLFAQDFQDAGAAESSLTAPHAGAGTQLDLRDGARAQGTADRVADLGFRDHFTAANDLRVIRILFDDRDGILDPAVLFSPLLLQQTFCVTVRKICFQNDRLITFLPPKP